jgi:hypothetical protein
VKNKTFKMKINKRHEREHDAAYAEQEIVGIK